MRKCQGFSEYILNPVESSVFARFKANYISLYRFKYYISLSRFKALTIEPVKITMEETMFSAVQTGRCLLPENMRRHIFSPKYPPWSDFVRTIAEL